LSDILLWT